mmetsp:Transcript_3446/g.6933  ORF Transcript_3446/g.6933 Transcript_3446/m.6933 type:complete len:148 (-) Transcript_3446:367-810(-)
MDSKAQQLLGPAANAQVRPRPQRQCRAHRQRALGGMALGIACVLATTWAVVGPLFVASPNAAQRSMRVSTAAAAAGESEPEPERGSAYYAGMFTSPMKEEDLDKDMVTPTLKFVGYSTGAIVLLLLAFLGSNGNLGADPKSQPLPGF